MSLINYASREITCKIVYYGPARSGKTTNLQYVHGAIAPDRRAEMVSLATETDRTLFFDFLPVDLGSISGFRTRIQLYTVPGQVYYGATRKLVLRGADGVVFVADSRRDRLSENVESLQNLGENLRENGIEPRGLPLVVQYNKRDLENILPIAELRRNVNQGGMPEAEAVALTGEGVLATLRKACERVLAKLGGEFEAGAGTTAGRGRSS